ncbi:MAG: hypothetical protein HPY70_12370 [Firmicutes bacterium]|nr:hypothetical protein [Bacillota bacterium]
MKRKLLALAVAVIFILGTVATGFAAVAEDVKDTEYEDAVVRLGALNVLTGFPDGTFRPDNPITRAQFAAVAVRLLGLDDAAKYAKGTTQFSDVGADHWASGYINIAVNRGIIKGYPDGTFMPEKEVTYNEAVTMLVRVLGYGPAADSEGTWPANYIAKGAELGVTDGVSFYGGAPAKRGDIALMSDNSLDIPLMERVGYGDEATYEVKEDKTLLTDKIKAETKKAILVATPLVDLNLDDDEISVRLWDDSSEEYETATEEFDVYKDANIDFEAFLGEEVTLWLNKDDEVFFVERETAKKDLVVGQIDEIDADSVTIVFDNGDDDEYDFADSVKVYINLKDDSYDETNLAVGMYVKAILDEDGEIATVVATDWSVGVVEDVDEDDEEIEFKYVEASAFEDNSGDLALEDMEYDLDLSDLEEDMIVYYYSVLVDEDDEIYKFFFETYDKTKVGELEEYKDEDYVVVDGKEYDLAYALVGDNDFADITGLLGDDVKVFFGKDGKVVMIELDTASEEEKDYALVTDVAYDADKYNNYTAYIKLLTASGDIIEYEVSDEAIIKEDTAEIDMDSDTADIDISGNTLTFGYDTDDNGIIDSSEAIDIVENDKEFTTDNGAENTLVKYSLDKDGKIDELEVVGTYRTDQQVDKDDNQIGTDVFADDSTLVFDAYNEKVIKFNDLKDGEKYTIKYVLDDDSLGDAEVIVVYSDLYVEDTEYAVYISKSNIADDQYKLKVMIDGEVKYFNTDMGSDAATVFGTVYKGQIFSLDFDDNKVADADLVNEDTEKFTDEVEDIDVTKNRVKLTTNGYKLFADDVQVYIYELNDDGTVDEVKAAKVRDVKDGQKVNVILDSDGYIEYIFIIDKDVDEDPAVISDIEFQP